MTTLPLILAVLAGMSNAVMGVLAKQAERSACRPVVMPVLFLGTVTVIAACALPVARSGWGDRWLWTLAVGMGLGYVAALQSMLLANRSCPPSLVWSLTNLSLVVPIALAPLLLHESWKPLDGLLIAAFVAMLALYRLGMGQTGEAAKVPWSQAWLPLIGVFFSNGLLMLGYKVKMQHWPEVGAFPFIVLIFGTGALLGLLAVCRSRTRIANVEWQWGTLMGTAAMAANFCLLGAVVLPAVVAFPLIQGTALVGGTLLMLALFGEPLNLCKISGLCCGGLVLALAMLR